MTHQNFREHPAAQGTSTFFALMAEFGSGFIELERVCDKFFGLAPSEAKRRAALHRLPIPAFKSGSQKSGWIISLNDLAALLDERARRAREEWSKSQTKAVR